MESEKRDLISGLPDVLISHILSFLPTKEAASTSVLLTKWRYLFALFSNLDFDDSVYLDPLNQKISTRIKGALIYLPDYAPNYISTSFMDFVDRVLSLQGDSPSPINKFSLKMEDGDDPVDPVRVIGWILNVLQRGGVSDLNVCMALELDPLLPSKIFSTETLVRLKLSGVKIDFEDVYLPKLKALYLGSVRFQNDCIGFTKLLSGCPMLDNLVLDDTYWLTWEFASASITTLKVFNRMRAYGPFNVSLDILNLIYLEFTCSVACKYPKVNFDSLVEAKIDLGITSNQRIGLQIIEEARISQGNVENEMVAYATNFILGICNVKILYLSSDTLEVLTYCNEAMPIFINLTHLSIESNPEVGWESLPGLLKNSPNLETLVLQGLVHKPCEDTVGEEKEKEINTCLSTSPVKVLKVLNFGEIFDDHDIKEQIKQVKHFLETMPNLEQLILYYDPSFEENVIEVSIVLQRLPRVASQKCEIQLISDNLYLSSKWGSSPALEEPGWVSGPQPCLLYD